MHNHASLLWVKLGKQQTANFTQTMHVAEWQHYISTSVGGAQTASPN